LPGDEIRLQGGDPPGKPGKVMEFDVGLAKVGEIRNSQGEVREITVCRWRATAVSMVIK